MAKEFSDDITIKELVQEIKLKKAFIAIFTLIFFLISSGIAFYLPNKYESEVLVAPANPEGSQDSISSGFSGLAGLAGISLDSPGQSKVQEALEVIKSRKFINDFINKYQLKAAIMASEGWNKDLKQIEFDSSIYDDENDLWKKEPSDIKTIKTFQDDLLSYSEDKKTGFIKISITTISPELSREWVELLLLELNSYFREQTIYEASMMLSFLEIQVEKAKFIEIRKSIFNLMEEQIKIVTLAEGRPEYMFRTLDPAIIPEIKASPLRTLIILLSSLSGLIIALAYTLFHFVLRPED